MPPRCAAATAAGAVTKRCAAVVSRALPLGCTHAHAARVPTCFARSQLQTLAMFREFCEGFEADRKASEAKLNQVTECLRQVSLRVRPAHTFALGARARLTEYVACVRGRWQAVADIVFLTKRNQELETQVHELAKWEPKS